MQSLCGIFRKLPAAVLLAAFILIYPFSLSAAEKKKFVVVIDAGHGGTDTGAIEHGVKEKDVNLDVALKLGELIKKKLKNTEVVYTRSTDNFVSLQGRADIANKAKGDLFVSIHCNSVDRSNTNRSNVVGATTYVLGHHKDDASLAVAQRENLVVELDANDKAHYSEFDPSQAEMNIIYEMTSKKNFQNSVRFAADVQKEMAAAGRYSRGVKQAGFWVLWSTAMPAALVELDFICNPDQAKFLKSKDGQDKLAGAIFNAVKSYESYFRKNLGAYIPDEPDDSKADSEPQTLLASSEPVEIPAADKAASPRTHRVATTEQKKNSNGSHRRRSAAGRSKAGSYVEESVIAVVEEVVPEPVVEKTVSKAEPSTPKNKPGRRDRDKTPKRKGVKKGVNVGYKVLLLVSDEELRANDDVFKGLKPIASFRENNQFKYTYGESYQRADMEKLLEEISSQFPEARVIKCYY